MKLYGLLANAQLGSDLRVGQAVGATQGYLRFAPAQVVDADDTLNGPAERNATLVCLHFFRIGREACAAPARENFFRTKNQIDSTRVMAPVFTRYLLAFNTQFIQQTQESAANCAIATNSGQGYQATGAERAHARTGCEHLSQHRGAQAVAYDGMAEGNERVQLFT